jgi:hypothetical protein
VARGARTKLQLMRMSRLVVFSAIACWTQAAGAQTERRVSPEADRLLRRMSDFLGQQKSFTVKVDGVTEIILQSGQKVQVHASGVAYVKRPDKLRIEKAGDDGGTLIVCDGKALTVYSKRQNVYVSTPASGTLDATMSNIVASGQIELPAADLLYSNSYQGLMDEVVSGQSLGTSIVDGVPTHHLAFQGRDVDWQIWIEDGPRPLPRKYVITTKGLEGSPEYEIVLSGWTLDPKLGDDLFRFQPPAGAQPRTP